MPLVELLLTSEQAEWLLDAAERGADAWGVSLDAAVPAWEAMARLAGLVGRDRASYDAVVRRGHELRNERMDGKR